ncbi:kinase-like protein [Aspergillus minisclerotigenes]|uniref:Kinase-like protein n=1 Tax=Aspergillus minisclerotigenes TaxID=656917 RepID=A0A5N6JC45_9EURO|nr:kinase-like protein [Aspergillus minisclerotigenes]
MVRPITCFVTYMRPNFNFVGILTTNASTLLRSTTAQPVDSEPRIDILCSIPGFSVPNPATVKEKVNKSNTIFHWGGVTIAKISPEIVVKFGSHVTLNEAKKYLFAYYTYGPIHRDILDYGSLFDTYIFMSFVEGHSLDKARETYDEATKSRVTNQLKGFIHELREIPPRGYIGSVDFSPVDDPILDGPFTTKEAFDNALISAYQAKVPRCHIKSFLAGMLSQNKHQVVFTHGDLRLANIMVNNGNVTGIVDWEFGGWYPEYWEFSKALAVWMWQNDWSDYLQQIMTPYYSGFAIYSFMNPTLW